ncbi:MAG TPA: M56 family metallopeptidase [Longimicrobiales bacterium]|nr:M56 family metallopeptidase [Longimicrobiales bacterium]
MDWKELVVAWVLTYALHSSVLLFIAFLGDRRLIRAPGLREYVWKTAAFGAIISASLQVAALTNRPESAPITGRWEMPVLPVRSVETELPSVPAIQAEAAATSITAKPSRPVRDWREILIGVWLIAAAFGALRVALRHRALRRYVGPRAPADATLADSLHQLVQSAGIAHNIRLTTCNRNISPLVLARGEICVPTALMEQLSARQQKSVLAHELAHIARRDPDWVFAFTALEILVPFQMLNWLARRRVRECAEFLCDSRAAELMASPVPLAETLVDVARWLHADLTRFPVPAMAGNRKMLSHRVERLLDGAVERTPAWTPLMCAAVIVAFMFVAPAITAAVQHQELNTRLPIPAFEFRGNLSNVSKLADAYNAWRQKGADVVSEYVKNAGEATVRFTFEGRDGICGTGVEKDGTRMFALRPTDEWLPAVTATRMALYVTDKRGMKRDDLGVDGTWTTPCQKAPVRVDMRMMNGTLTLEITVGDPAPRVTGRLKDAGDIPAPVASAFLFRFAANDHALLAGVMAKGAISDDLYAMIADAKMPAKTKIAAREWIEALENHAQSGKDNVGIIKDIKYPLVERKAALARAISNGQTPAQVNSWYDRVPDRAMRVELINFLAQSSSTESDQRLNDIAQRANVVEEQDAALKALAKTSNLGTESVLKLVLDPRQPLETRKKALVWAGTHGASKQFVESIVEDIESRELKQFVKEWLKKQ